jgi:hypothetical protein
MRMPFGVSLVVTAWLSYSNAILAQPSLIQNTGPIALKSVADLNQQGTGVKVIGGREARSEDWQASFYAEGGGNRCTATLVGPRALLLAAHCVGNGQSAKIEFRQEPISGQCIHAVGYKDSTGDQSADYALCYLDKEVSGIQFETVNVDPSRIKKSNRLLLTGYGCTRPPAFPGEPPSGGNDGKYRIADAKIAALPGEPGNEPNTILMRDKTAICNGDSGGGAFLVLTPKKRLIVAINSRAWFDKGQSYLSSLSSAAGSEFIDTWIKTNQNAKICGRNLKDESCR